MNNAVAKARARRKKRVRAAIIGKSAYPRLSIFRSNKYIYAQVIVDAHSHTVAAASDVKLKSQDKANKTERARRMGLEFGALLIEKKITRVIFDRGAYAYKGRVQAVAEGVREAGVTI